MENINCKLDQSSGTKNCEHFFFEQPTMYRLARRAILSKPYFLQAPYFLPISFRLARTIPTTATAPYQCTPIRCNSSISSLHIKGEEIPDFIRPGDWLCGNCQAHNYRSRINCFECQNSITSGRVIYTSGMWHCPKCNQPAKKMGSLAPSHSCHY
jgi:hypothetical protein